MTSTLANVWFQIKTIMNNFYPLEAVGCGSETQLQVGLKNVIVYITSLGVKYPDKGDKQLTI